MYKTNKKQRGSTMVEVMITVSLFTVVLLSSLAMVESGRRFSSSTMEITTVEDLAQQMLFKMEGELANAFGVEPVAEVTAELDPGNTISLQVDSTLGFPPFGTILVDRGTQDEERISYEGLSTDQERFTTLVRGEQCTSADYHLDGATLMWQGLAEPLELQDNPPATAYDGIAMEEGRQVYFRGDGTGFSYRVPIDPNGGNNYLNGDDLFWGAELQGTGPTLDGYMALYFLPKTMYDEAETGDDINEDGDAVDVFDVGQIRRLTWDATDPNNQVDDVGLGPSAVLQERCNWGGDLNDDGFDDPIFLWDKESNQLHVRLFVLGRSLKAMPVVRTVESVMFLRNEPEL